jgi:hypothetical protein
VAAIDGVLAGTESGKAVFEDFGTAVADKLLEVVKETFVAGVQLSFQVVAGLALVGLVIAVLAVRPPSPAADADGHVPAAA